MSTELQPSPAERSFKAVKRRQLYFIIFAVLFMIKWAWLQYSENEERQRIAELRLNLPRDAAGIAGSTRTAETLCKKIGIAELRDCMKLGRTATAQDEQQASVAADLAIASLGYFTWQCKTIYSASECENLLLQARN